MNHLYKHLGAAAFSICILTACSDSDECEDCKNKTVTTTEYKHLQGSYDLQKYYMQRGEYNLFYVVPTGGNGRFDGGAFRWDIDKLCITAPDTVCVYIGTAGDVVQNGAYSLNTVTGQIEGPLPDPETYPWIDAQQYYDHQL